MDQRASGMPEVLAFAPKRQPHDGNDTIDKTGSVPGSIRSGRTAQSGASSSIR
jgi:hypothetical protein